VEENICRGRTEIRQLVTGRGDGEEDAVIIKCGKSLRRMGNGCEKRSQ
jgi:hypothetical protein